MLLSTPAGSIPGTKGAGGSGAQHHVCLAWGPAAVSSEAPDALWHLSVPTKPTKALLDFSCFYHSYILWEGRNYTPFCCHSWYISLSEVAIFENQLCY